jgi:hypothetical protein
MSQEFDRLTDEQKAAVRQAIDLARKSTGQHTVRCADGSEAYASRHPGGGISWGVNGDHYGWCLARGIEP